MATLLANMAALSTALVSVLAITAVVIAWVPTAASLTQV